MDNYYRAPHRVGLAVLLPPEEEQHLGSHDGDKEDEDHLGMH